jgi:ABC-2 type transport system ATP-binding protein
MLNQKMNPLKHTFYQKSSQTLWLYSSSKNVSFDIHKGNVYEFQPNGSGKSTTLGIVLNVVNKTSGEYNWFNGTIETHEALKKVGAIIERPNFIRT